jgi:hypothetical protein
MLILINGQQNSSNLATCYRWEHIIICDFCVAIPMMVSMKATANRENNFNHKTTTFELSTKYIHLICWILAATASPRIREINSNPMLD